jgi:hypothetical protein
MGELLVPLSDQLLAQPTEQILRHDRGGTTRTPTRST